MPRRPVTWSRAIRLYLKHTKTAAKRADRTARALERFKLFARRFGSDCPEEITLGQLLEYQRRRARAEAKALGEFFQFLNDHRLI